MQHQIKLFLENKIQYNKKRKEMYQRNTIGKQFSHMTNCHLLKKVFKLQALWSSHLFINKG